LPDDLITNTTVDQYQGEENDIITSLVRSEDIGFLKEKTRIFVAMTRARQAFNCIGNLEFLAEKDVWKDIIREAKSRGFA
jgi:superfamily I DNA and/or RNA helicase